jgi:hypothetical protein
MHVPGYVIRGNLDITSLILATVNGSHALASHTLDVTSNVTGTVDVVSAVDGEIDITSVLTGTL